MEEIAVKEERVRLAATANVTASGEFEVLAINAGEGNGWQFSPEALRGSLPLWEGVETFVDHTPEPRVGHSLRDLAGICTRAALRRGTKGGGGAPAPQRTQRRAAAGTGAAVAGGARAAPAGGLFGRPGLHRQGETRGAHPARALVGRGVQPGARRVVPARAQCQQGGLDDRKCIGNRFNPAAGDAAAELEKAREARAQMCACLLDSSLASARLPAPLAERVRARFAGRSYEPARTAGGH